VSDGCSRMESTPNAPSAKVLGAGPVPTAGPVLLGGGIRTAALHQRGDAAPLILGEWWRSLDNPADVILEFRGCVVAALTSGGCRVAGAFGCAGNICAHLFE
jgi:hypothetical protein